MQVDHSKDMTVHVSTCISYDFNTLTPVVWKFWHWQDVYVSTSHQKYEWSIFRAKNQY